MHSIHGKTAEINHLYCLMRNTVNDYDEKQQILKCDTLILEANVLWKDIYTVFLLLHNRLIRNKWC